MRYLLIPIRTATIKNEGKKESNSQMSVRMWRNWNSYVFLVGT